MSGVALSSLWVTVKVAGFATLLSAPLALALAYYLARSRGLFRELCSAFFSLPLVVPPTAVGYLLLHAFSSQGPLGERTLPFDLNVLFTLKGAVIAASVMAFPLLFKTAQVAFENVSPRYEKMAQSLGHSSLRTFFVFTLPLARRGLFAALILGFMRAVGEFGATIVVAGSIAGKTRTLASAIYTAEQAGDTSQAWLLITVALVAGFLSMWICERLLTREKS